MRRILAAAIVFPLLAPAQQAEKRESAATSESKPKPGVPALDKEARKNILDKIRISQRLMKGTLLYRIDGGAVVRTEKGEDVCLHGPIPNVPDNSPIEVLAIRSGVAAFAGPTEFGRIMRYFTDINEVLELLIATSSRDELKRLSAPPGE